jgi:hypothetical protein
MTLPGHGILPQGPQLAPAALTDLSGYRSKLLSGIRRGLRISCRGFSIGLTFDGRNRGPASYGKACEEAFHFQVLASHLVQIHVRHG